MWTAQAWLEAGPLGHGTPLGQVGPGGYESASFLRKPLAAAG